MSQKLNSFFSNHKTEEEKNETLSKIFQLGIETLFLPQNIGKSNLEFNPQNFSDSQIQYIGEIFNLAQM
ncbi:MAG: hypothetical protein ACW967_03725 [Candidatus Hodarchaeales archaeon]|jgi:hypothetical protein